MNIFKTKIYAIEKQTTRGYVPVEVIARRWAAFSRTKKRVKQLERKNKEHEYRIRYLGYKEDRK